MPLPMSTLEASQLVWINLSGTTSNQCDASHEPQSINIKQVLAQSFPSPAIPSWDCGAIRANNW
jgi:hypothetical protein